MKVTNGITKKHAGVWSRDIFYHCLQPLDVRLLVWCFYTTWC